MQKQEKDISNAELLAAINAGFTQMQVQMDQRFDENAREHATMNERHDSMENRLVNIESTLEDHGDRLGSIENKLDATIASTDRLDERLTIVESADRLVRTK